MAHRWTAIAIALVAPVAVVAVTSPLSPASAQLARGFESASGTKNCGGSGNIAVSAAFNDSGGIHVNVKQDGSPATARRWSRTKDAYPPRSSDDDVTWTFVGSIKQGKWGASKIQAVGPDLLASAQCDRRSLPNHERVAHARGGVKDCPAGQTVIIESDGYGWQWYSWKGTKPRAKVHHVEGFRQQAGFAFVTGFVDTNMNKVSWRRVDVYPDTQHDAEHWIEAWSTSCSSAYDIERD